MRLFKSSKKEVIPTIQILGSNPKITRKDKKAMINSVKTYFKMGFDSHKMEKRLELKFNITVCVYIYTDKNCINVVI